MIYLKQLNPHTGGLIPSILFARVCFLYQTVNRPFYKFLCPCEHPMFRAGKDDSWTEELDVSRHVVNTILKKVGTKLKRGKRYNLLKCNLILYWSAGHGITYFIPNYPKLMLLGLGDNFLKKHFPHFIKWKSKLPKSEYRIFEIEFRPSQQWNFGLSLHNKTQDKTHNKTQKQDISSDFSRSDSKNEVEKNEKSSAKKEKLELVLPFDSPEFRKIFDEWIVYIEEEHRFKYNHKNAQSLLHLLEDYDETFSKQLILKAMSSGWKSFLYPDTPQKFRAYQQGMNKINSNSNKKFDENVSAIFHKY